MTNQLWPALLAEAWAALSADSAENGDVRLPAGLEVFWVSGVPGRLPSRLPVEDTDPEHLETGREPEVRARSVGGPRRPRLGQQARPQLFRHPAHSPRTSATRPGEATAMGPG